MNFFEYLYANIYNNLYVNIYKNLHIIIENIIKNINIKSYQYENKLKIILEFFKTKFVSTNIKKPLIVPHYVPKVNNNFICIEGCNYKCDCVWGWFECVEIKY